MEQTIDSSIQIQEVKNKIVKQKLGFEKILLISFIFAASMLTHLIPFLTFFYSYIIYVIYLYFKEKDNLPPRAQS